MIRTRSVLALGFLSWTALTAKAAGDGGRLLAREEAGTFIVALFAKPQLVSVGTADLSVLVCDRRTSAALLDAEVSLVLAGPGGASDAESMSRPTTGNRLFYAARVVLPEAGEWRALVRVRRNGVEATLRCAFPVAAASTRAAAALPVLAVPPVAIALFAANRALRRRTKRAREEVASNSRPRRKGVS